MGEDIANDRSNKGLVSKIYKELIKPAPKKQTKNQKCQGHERPRKTEKHNINNSGNN